MDRPSHPALPRLRILVVEDDKPQRTLLATFLGHLGQEVACAEDGEAAIQAFLETAPDLVLMDILLPGIDGFEATSRIQTLAEGQWVPVIYLTAMQQRASVIAAMAAGGHDYLIKPVDLEILEAKLQAVIKAIEAQNKLLAAEALLAMAFDPCESAAIGFTGDGTIIACNDGATRLLGLDREKLRQQRFPALLSGPNAPKHCADFLAMAGGAAVRVDVRRADGSWRQVRLTVLTRSVKLRPVFLGLLDAATTPAGNDHGTRIDGPL